MSSSAIGWGSRDRSPIDPSIAAAAPRPPSPPTSRDGRVFTVLGGIAGALTWPVLGIAWSAYHIAKKIVGLVWLHNFWKPQEGEYNFKARLRETGFDFLKSSLHRFFMSAQK